MAETPTSRRPDWDLASLPLGHIQQHQYQVAVLPLGATEPHNLHLPYGTDTLEANLVGREICQAAHAEGARVLLLPTIPYGTETNLREFPFAMNLNPSTLYQVITDLVASLTHSGILKIVLLNSHGGNEFKPLLRELYGQTPAHLFLCNWYQVFQEAYHEIFQEPEDHAGELETSLALAYFPELVATAADGRLAADEGARRPLRFEALAKGWVGITRPWHLLTTNAGSGNPHAATAEKGRQAMELLVERLGKFLCELSEAELNDQFPFA